MGVEYQPIVDLRTRDVVAHEALARFVDAGKTCVPTSDVFAGLHQDPGRLCALEIEAKALQIEHAPAGPLYLNVDPDAWAAAEGPRGNPLVELLRGRDDVVVETIENQHVRDADRSREMAVALNAVGLPVALDDVGAAETLLSLDALFNASILKLDRSVLRQLGDPRRRDFYGDFVTAVRRLGLYTVAEGVETEADLAAARALGVDAAQGFFFRSAFRLVTP
jgi:EAL domain-containing protein (putative c-di-GMP-specific phosphodiesterase class I)